MAFDVGTPYVGPLRKLRRPSGRAQADAVAEPARLARLAARRRANTPTDRTEESSP